MPHKPTTLPAKRVYTIYGVNKLFHLNLIYHCLPLCLLSFRTCTHGDLNFISTYGHCSTELGNDLVDLAPFQGPANKFMYLYECCTLVLLPPSQNINIFSYEFRQLCVQIHGKKLLYFGTETVTRLLHTN